MPDPIEIKAGLCLQRSVWRDALLFSLFAFLCSLPHLAFELSGQGGLPLLLQEKVLRGDIPLQALLSLELGRLFFVLLLCTALAMVFRDRYQLPALSLDTLRKSFADRGVLNALLLLLLFLPLFFWFSFVIYEEQVRELLPGLYPQTPWSALAKALANAFTFEVVGRLGLLTVGCGIFRRRLPANIAVSLFFCFLLIITLKRYDTLGPLQASLWLPLTTVFLSNFLLNAVYFRKGIFICLLVQFLLNLKFLAYALF